MFFSCLASVDPVVFLSYIVYIEGDVFLLNVLLTHVILVSPCGSMLEMCFNILLHYHRGLRTQTCSVILNPKLY